MSSDLSDDEQIAISIAKAEGQRYADSQLPAGRTQPRRQAKRKAQDQIQENLMVENVWSDTFTVMKEAKRTKMIQLSNKGASNIGALSTHNGRRAQENDSDVNDERNKEDVEDEHPVLDNEDNEGTQNDHDHGENPTTIHQDYDAVHDDNHRQPTSTQRFSHQVSKESVAVTTQLPITATLEPRENPLENDTPNLQEDKADAPILEEDLAENEDPVTEVGMDPDDKAVLRKGPEDYEDLFVYGIGIARQDHSSEFCAICLSPIEEAINLAIIQKQNPDLAIWYCPLERCNTSFCVGCVAESVMTTRHIHHGFTSESTISSPSPYRTLKRNPKCPCCRRNWSAIDVMKHASSYDPITFYEFGDFSKIKP
ncbi:uncharacterized protein IL334_001148 [Kwoniella shivajii]|uniref:RING-type domain-containing protein n=1 Tax=Kwoniella shivajii TaxID=564305 RepID=A0ABZ1CSR4_9TREE|nr:hypothetical protein IL334_001148 [Kwoniella shivajii]